VNIRTINEKRILSCGILETPRFGRKSNFLFVPGSTVAFECNEGFVLVGDPRRTCTSEGRWDPAIYGYTECMRHVFYSRRTAWIAIGIILVVILPIIMCVVCAVYCYRQKQIKEDPEWKMSLPRSRSGSRATLRHLGSDNDQDTLKKKKKWDLDDEDFTSSDGSEFPPTKAANDIEYMNRSNPQRQSGRRGMQLSGGDQPPIEEEETSLPLPPPPQATGIDELISPNYSPTFSGLDRNSSGFSGPQPQTFNLRQPNAIRVMPIASTSVNNNRFFGEGSMSPTSARSPTPPNQDVGLPKPNNAKSTEV